MKPKLLILFCLLPFATLPALRAADRPNILWLIGDDLGVELGCYGNHDVRTPNMDQIAAEGVCYSRFYTTAPVCSSSRSAFNTGMYAHALHAENHRTRNVDKRPLPEGVKVITDWLRGVGYYTANVGQFPSDFGFSEHAKTDWNFVLKGKPFDGNNWDDLRAHQPFYAQINFSEPHRDFHAPPRTDPNTLSLPRFYPDTPVFRADWAMYLDAVDELDRKIGMVLKQLAADGLADDTIIIVLGDNGRPHIRDKQFCYEEGLHVPLLIRWPKHFPAPAGLRPGAREDRLVEAIDLVPTTLALAGAPIPATMQGRNFVGPNAAPAREYAFGARDRCDETVLKLRTARDARYRYILNLMPEKPLMAGNEYKEMQYPGWNAFKRLAFDRLLTPAQARFAAPHATTEELYDLQSDPDELENLAGNPAFAAIRDQMRAALEQWRTEIGDPR